MLARELSQAERRFQWIASPDAANDESLLHGMLPELRSILGFSTMRFGNCKVRPTNRLEAPCLSQGSAADWLTMLSNRSVVFVGDSVLRDLFLYLCALVTSASPASARVSSEFAPPHRRNHFQPTRDMTHTGRHPGVLVALHGRFVGNAHLGWCWFSDTWCVELAQPTADLVVYHHGAHDVPYDKAAGNDGRIMASDWATTALMSMFAHRLVFMEYPAAHFPWGHGEYEDEGRREALEQTCADAASCGASRRACACERSLGCQPAASTCISRFAAHRLRQRHIFEAAGVPILRVWELARHDDHPSLADFIASSHSNITTIDCRHVCVPGVVVSAWARRLYTMLQQQRVSGSGAECPLSDDVAARTRMPPVCPASTRPQQAGRRLSPSGEAPAHRRLDTEPPAYLCTACRSLNLDWKKSAVHFGMTLGQQWRRIDSCHHDETDAAVVWQQLMPEAREILAEPSRMVELLRRPSRQSSALHFVGSSVMLQQFRALRCGLEAAGWERTATSDHIGDLERQVGGGHATLYERWARAGAVGEPALELQYSRTTYLSGARLYLERGSRLAFENDGPSSSPRPRITTIVGVDSAFYNDPDVYLRELFNFSAAAVAQRHADHRRSALIIRDPLPQHYSGVDGRFHPSMLRAAACSPLPLNARDFRVAGLDTAFNGTMTSAGEQVNLSRVAARLHGWSFVAPLHSVHGGRSNRSAHEGLDCTHYPLPVSHGLNAHLALLLRDHAGS